MEELAHHAGAFRAGLAHDSGLEASDEREPLDRAGDNLRPFSGPATSARNFFRRLIQLRAKHRKALYADQESQRTRLLIWHLRTQFRKSRWAAHHTESRGSAAALAVGAA